jgi:hypothetical protein
MSERYRNPPFYRFFIKALSHGRRTPPSRLYPLPTLGWNSPAIRLKFLPCAVVSCAHNPWTPT